MSQLEVERFLGRLVTDAAFREKAGCSLATACFAEGIVLSREELKLLGRLDFSRFGGAALGLDDSLRRR